jgi:DNA-binding transcriptional MerR regulator
LNNISNRFTIKDLENLSGIKAHTIRIWEKRYGVLEPSRTDSNIRYYDVEALKKLLNVTLLYNAGIKISKVAEMTPAQLQDQVRDHMVRNGGENGYMDALVLSMLNFDQSLFEHTFNKLIAEYSFRHVFLKVFVPLLHNIGIHWQSDSITPAHEHFVSNLIKQKLHLSLERVQQNIPIDHDVTYVLFLPDNEIHELGLLYVHYELMLKGLRSIYLGQSVPMTNLVALQSVFGKIQFVSYFTVKPEVEQVNDYLKAFNTALLQKRPEDELWITGRNVREREDLICGSSVKLFNDIEQIVNKI